MTAMTTPQTVAALAAALDEVWSAVGELVLIVHEDRPLQADLAFLDDFAEQVSEIQGDVAAACRILVPGPQLGALPVVATHLGAAERRYWRSVRGHPTVVELRLAARRVGGEFAGWRRSVERSAEHCEAPLVAAADALLRCWREICGEPPDPPPPGDDPLGP